MYDLILNFIINFDFLQLKNNKAMLVVIGFRHVFLGKVRMQGIQWEGGAWDETGQR